MARVSTTAVARRTRTPAVAEAAAVQARARLLRRLPSDRVTGWVAPAVIAAIAGVLRLWRLGEPHAFAFDETYYAKDAWSLLHHGAEQEYKAGADARILAGDLEQWTGNPSYVVHPPGGKWVIAAGEALLGFDPVGWRIAVALLGTLSVLVIARVARRMFASTLLGCVAATLLAFDGMHFVQSRTALLDLILMFWVLVAFACLLVDRDATRARLATALRDQVPVGGFGPRLGLRPWRLGAGVCLGLACATKWSGLWFVVGFGLLSYAWDVSARRAAGLPAGRAVTAVVAAAGALAAALAAVAGVGTAWAFWLAAAALAAVAGVIVVARALAQTSVRPRRGRPRGRGTLAGAVGHVSAAVSSLVLVPLGVYLLTWSGWFTADPKRAYNRLGGADPAGFAGLVPQPLRALWDYHRQALKFHSSLRDPHPYSSNPWSWPVLGRPVSFFYEGPKRGEQGCAVDSCSKAVTAIGTPAVWWAAALAVLVVVALWLGRRDWRAGAILAGVAAGYIPWFAFQERTVYSFYAIVFLPFLVLALTLCLGLLLGSRDAPPARRAVGAAVVGTYVLLVLANFAFLHPVLSADVIPQPEWSERMWLRSWI